MFYDPTHNRASILNEKSYLGLELSLDDKLFLAGQDFRDGRIYQKCGTFKCSGFVDREIGYHYMEKQQRLINEECVREWELSHGGPYHWTPEEMAVQREQLTDTDWTSLEETPTVLPKWKVACDRITELLDGNKND